MVSPRPPRSPLLPPGHERLSGWGRGQDPGRQGLLWLLIPLILLARLGFDFADKQGHAGWGLVAAACCLAACVGVFFWDRKRAPALIEQRLSQDRARLEEIAPQAAGTATRLEVRRGMPYGIPLIISGIVLIPVAAAFLSTSDAFAHILLMIPVIGVGICWMVAATRRGHLLTLTSAGIELPDGFVEWRKVQRVDLERVYLGRGSWRVDLVAHLHAPLPRPGWMARFGSAITRGATDSEVRVSLTRASESAEVIGQLAQELWRRVVGDAVAARGAAAHLDELRRRMAPTRPRYLVGIILLTILIPLTGLTIYATNATFVASPEWTTTSLWITLVSSALIAVVLARSGAFARARMPSSARARPVLVFLCVVAFSAAMIWLSVDVGIPDLWTRFHGALRSNEAHLDLRIDSSNGSACPYRIVGDDQNGHYSDHRCMSESLHARLQPDATSRVTYRETSLGRRIESITFRTRDDP